ncbi:MAG: DUF433 domain-containing protein [Gemmatimonadales bacterium]
MGHGQACIRGTRIPVAVVLANLAAGVDGAELFRSRRGRSAAPPHRRSLGQTEIP